MGLQRLAPRTLRRIERALNPPGKWHMCLCAPRGIHVWPERMTVASGVAAGGYEYGFTVADPSRLDGHRHGWMDLKLWHQYVKWPWGDLPGSVQSDCLFRISLVKTWQDVGVWGWWDDGTVSHWTSCRELFPVDAWGRLMCSCADSQDGAAFPFPYTHDGRMEVFCGRCGKPTGRPWKADTA